MPRRAVHDGANHEAFRARLRRHRIEFISRGKGQRLREHAVHDGAIHVQQSSAACDDTDSNSFSRGEGQRIRERAVHDDAILEASGGEAHHTTSNSFSRGKGQRCRGPASTTRVSDAFRSARRRDIEFIFPRKRATMPLQREYRPRRRRGRTGG
jgi:hypothetical protein